MRHALFILCFAFGSAGCDSLLGFEDLHGTVDAVDPDAMTDADIDGPDIDGPDIDAPPIDAPPIDAAIDAPIDAPPPQYTLTVARNGTGSGTVASAAPAGVIDCGGDCTHTLVTGTTVTLTATPATGSTFTGWSGPCSGTGNCTFGLTTNTTVTATFTLDGYTVTVNKSGTGQGIVSSSPGGLGCSNSCTTTSAFITHGTVVTLTQTPDAASDFTGWSGPSCPGRGSCSFTVTSNLTITASFMQPWTVLVDGPYPGGDDRGAGIAADPSGNVYVGGFTSHGPTAGVDEDLWVRKLTAGGATVWSDLYDGGGSETVRGMAASATHLFLSGYSYVNATNGRDIFLRRYSASGSADVPVTVNGPASSTDLGTKLTLDAAGNVYVVGHVTTSSGTTDGWVAKYNSSMAQLWSRTYNGPTGGTDVFHGVAVDAAGNVYVTGWQSTSGNGFDVVLRKYDSAGNVLWTQTYDRNAGDDWGYGVAVASTGDIYVAATITSSTGNTDAMILQYSSLGVAGWSSALAGGAVVESRDIVVCPGDNIYALGYQDIAGQGLNIWMRRLSTSGTTIWDRTHSGSANAEDIGFDAACDPSGNVLFAGWVDRPTNGQIWVRKYYQ